MSNLTNADWRPKNYLKNTIAPRQIEFIKRIADDFRKVMIELADVELKPTRVYNAFAIALGFSSFSELSIKVKETRDTEPTFDPDRDIWEYIKKESEELVSYLTEAENVYIKDAIEYRRYNLSHTDEPDVSFIGVLIGSAGESPDNAHSDYSGRTGRWNEYDIYKTIKGNYVGQIFEGTQWQGEHHTCKVIVVKDKQDLVDFFGYDRIAKELFNDAGIIVGQEYQDSPANSPTGDIEECEEVEKKPRSVPIEVLKMYLFGGYDGQNRHDGYNTFDEYIGDLQSIDDIKSSIQNCMELCEGGDIEYYGELYDVAHYTLTDDDMEDLLTSAIDKIIEDKYDDIRDHMDEEIIQKVEEEESSGTDLDRLELYLEKDSKFESVLENKFKNVWNIIKEKKLPKA